MLFKMLVTRGKMPTKAGQGWTPGNAMQDAGDEGKDANKRWARLDTRQCYARCWGRGEEGKDANKRWARLDTRQCYARCWGRGERCEQTLGKAGHQAMLCKMLVTRGKMRTDEGKDANKRWARLDTKQCCARCW